MKGFRATCLLILMVLFLPIWVSYAQSPTRESYDKGVEHATQGKFKEAKKEFEKALKIDVYNTTAKANLKTIKNATAQKIEREAVIHLFKGVSFDDKFQHDQAIKEFTKALEINPMYVEAYNNRGFTYRKKGEYDKAIKDYTKSLEINPGDDSSYINRGLVYDRKGQHDQAIKDYTKAIEINPICKAMVVDILLTRPDNRH